MPSRPRVYIETTIPSFYHEVRNDPENVARKNWTQHWWDFKRGAYDLYTSAAVIGELEAGDYPTRNAALSLLAGVSVLTITPDVLETVEAYIRHRLMPRDPTGDAIHLALASHHRCDLLLTWNCRHLANANKFPHIQQVNSSLGLHVPTIVTPIELLEEDN